jgi:predicted amino acid-binding ACT domain protein
MCADDETWLDGICLQGTGMVGVPGTASNVFQAMKEAQVNVVMISQVCFHASLSFYWAYGESSCFLVEGFRLCAERKSAREAVKETERHTETDRDTQRDKRQREAETPGDRQGDPERHRDTERERQTETPRQTETQTETPRQTERETERQIPSEAGTEIPRDRYIERH